MGTDTLKKIKPEQTKEEQKPLRICFVCTGNTCRSPMAAAVANHLAAEELSAIPEAMRPFATPKLIAFSAGLFANEGEPIAQNAVKALEAAEIQARGPLDYHGHTAHMLTRGEAEGYDYLIGLSGAHLMQLILQYPQLTSRLIGMPEEISDPYGGDEETYKKCLSQIQEGVKKLFFTGQEEKNK